MPIEEREQLGADDDIELVDFRDAEEPSPKITQTAQTLLDQADKEPQFKTFATPEHTQNRSTQMNTPHSLQKVQPRIQAAINQSHASQSNQASPDITVIQVSPIRKEARVSKMGKTGKGKAIKPAKVSFIKVNKSGITGDREGKRAVVGDTQTMLDCMKQNSSAY